MKGFGKYLEEKAHEEYDFKALLEGRIMSYEEVGKEFGMTKQGAALIVKGAMEKIFLAIQKQEPDLTPGQVFATICAVFKGVDPQTIYKSLGYKPREAIKQDAINRGIGV